MAAIIFRDVMTASNDVTFTFTLEGSGSISGGTVTASISEQSSPNLLISAHAMTITDAGNRVCTLVLTASESADLRVNHERPTDPVWHEGDLKLVLGGSTTNFGPFRFKVRKAVTA